MELENIADCANMKASKPNPPSLCTFLQYRHTGHLYPRDQASFCKTPAWLVFHFHYSRDAADTNAAILKKWDYNMRDVINTKKGTTMWYGSEYNPIPHLECIYT